MDNGSSGKLDQGTREVKPLGVNRRDAYESNRETSREARSIGSDDTAREGSKDTGRENLSESYSWLPFYGSIQSNVAQYRFENCRGIVRSRIIAAASMMVAFIVFILPIVAGN